MTKEQLYKKLINAYAEQNLHQIAVKLIALYKNKEFTPLIEIANRAIPPEEKQERSPGQCFAALIMLYHPDKGNLHRQQIEAAFRQKNYALLDSFAHILNLTDLEKFKPEAVLDPALDFKEEYAAEQMPDDYFEEETELNARLTFYAAIKQQVYGNNNIELPPHYLRDLESFDVAECGIEDLSGVEYCLEAKILDLSSNALTDLSLLRALTELEELYLADNQLGYIDVLSALKKLRILDLANNQLDDLEPLLDLPALEFVNLLGNRLPEPQLAALRKKGVVVLSELAPRALQGR